jgi:hypothetical protein
MDQAPNYHEVARRRALAEHAARFYIVEMHLPDFDTSAAWAEFAQRRVV